MVYNNILNKMWMIYYPLKMEELTLYLIFENTLQGFADDQSEKSCLVFSERRFIPTSRILH